MPASTTRTLRARRIGNSVGITIPKDLRERYGIEDKSDVRVTETPEGILLQTQRDADFAEAMEIFEEFSEQYKNALRELAK